MESLYYIWIINVQNESKITYFLKKNMEKIIVKTQTVSVFKCITDKI